MTAIAPSAAAEDRPWPLPPSAETARHSLAAVAEKYGPDAVLLQAYLLNECLRTGSILETAVSAPTVAVHAGHTYLAVTLDSGLIFNDRTARRETRILRVWRQVVERALRRYDTLHLRTDGIAVRVNYHHRRYVDEAHLRADLRAGRGKPETVLFYLLTADILGLLRHQLSSREFLDRSRVLVDGQPYTLQLPAHDSPAPAPRSPPQAMRNRH